jgi:hypothetical protein
MACCEQSYIHPFKFNIYTWGPQEKVASFSFLKYDILSQILNIITI